MSSSDFINLNHRNLMMALSEGRQKSPQIDLGDWIFESGDKRDVVVAVFTTFPAMTIRIGNPVVINKEAIESHHKAILLDALPSDYKSNARQVLLRRWSAYAFLGGATLRGMEIDIGTQLLMSPDFLKDSIENLHLWPFEMRALGTEAEMMLIGALHDVATGDSKKHILNRLEYLNLMKKQSFIKTEVKNMKTPAPVAQKSAQPSLFLESKRDPNRIVADQIPLCDYKELLASDISSPFTQGMREIEKYAVLMNLRTDWVPGDPLKPMVEITAVNGPDSFKNAIVMCLIDPNIEASNKPTYSQATKALKGAAACFGVPYCSQFGHDVHIYSHSHAHWAFRNDLNLVLQMIEVWPFRAHEKLKPLAKYRATLGKYGPNHRKTLEAKALADQAQAEINTEIVPDNVLTASFEDSLVDDVMASIVTQGGALSQATSTSQKAQANVFELQLLQSESECTPSHVVNLRGTVDFAESKIFEITQQISITKCRIEVLESMTKELDKLRDQVADLKSSLQESQDLKDYTMRALGKLSVTA